MNTPAKTLALSAFVLGAMTLSAAASAQTLSVTPTDDVWAYSNAGDPANDINMRVWGNGVIDSTPTWPPVDISHGYVKFDLSSIPANSVITGATLTLTHQYSATSGQFNQAYAQQFPLLVRALGNFSESTWDYSNPANPAPQALYGTGSAANFPTTVDTSLQAVRIPVALGAGFFSDANAALASTNKSISLALTSAIPLTSQTGGGKYYRIYSSEYGIPGAQPTLSLTYSPVPEPASLAVLGLGAFALVRRRRSAK